MKRHALFGTVVLLILMPRANAQKPFTLGQVISAPFPSSLTAAKNANRIAWVLDQEGRRNIWVAEGPAFTARQLTKYNEDDCQELLDLHFSSDSNTIVYVRGEGKNAAGQVPNPPAILQEPSRQFGPWRGTGASPSASTPAIRRRFLPAEQSRTSRMGRSGSRHWMEPISRNN